MLKRTVLTIVITAAVVLCGVYFYNQYKVKAIAEEKSEKIERSKQAEKEREIERKKEEQEQNKKNNVREMKETADKTVEEDPRAVIETSETNLEALDNSEAISYGELAKAADRYKDKTYAVTARVDQAIEENGETILRVSALGSDLNFTNEFYIYYPGITDAVEGNIVDIYGYISGKKSYTNNLGAQVTLPALDAYSIEVK